MECNEVISLIDDYYDDTLQDDLRIEVDKHLGSCFKCNATYNEMQNYFKQLKSFSLLIEKPVTLHKEITAELMEEEKPPEEIVPKKKGFRLFKKG